jgi:ACT domain-containing protein
MIRTLSLTLDDMAGKLLKPLKRWTELILQNSQNVSRIPNVIEKWETDNIQLLESVEVINQKLETILGSIKRIEDMV